LHRLLAKFLSPVHLKWAQRFPLEFFRQVFRLHGWIVEGRKLPQGPRRVAQIINDIVYRRLGPEVLEELRVRNPIVRPGQRRYRHHQYFSEDIGHPVLERHMVQLVSYMQVSRTWPEAMGYIDQFLPIRSPLMLARGSDEMDRSSE
jgi:hypothetical protein